MNFAFTAQHLLTARSFKPGFIAVPESWIKAFIDGKIHRKPCMIEKTWSIVVSSKLLHHPILGLNAKPGKCRTLLHVEWESLSWSTPSKHHGSQMANLFVVVIDTIIRHGNSSQYSKNMSCFPLRICENQFDWWLSPRLPYCFNPIVIPEILVNSTQGPRAFRSAASAAPNCFAVREMRLPRVRLMRPVRRVLRRAPRQLLAPSSPTLE